jgi:hypothetical protein
MVDKAARRPAVACSPPSRRLPAVLLYLVLSRRHGGAFTFGGAMKG